MKRGMLVLAACGALLTGTAFATPAAPQSAAEAISAANSRFTQAYRRGDAASMAADYAPDGRYIGGKIVLRGRTAIENFFRSRLGRAHFLDGTCRTTELTVREGIALESGRCAYTFERSGKTLRSDSSYFTVWVRDRSQRWKIHTNVILPQ